MSGQFWSGGGTSSGGGGSPTGTAGGELAGSYPNPTIADGKIDDANIVSGGLTNAAIATSAAIAASKLDGTLAPLASPTFTGTPTLPTGTISTTQAVGDSSTKLASTAFVAANAATIAGTIGGPPRVVRRSGDATARNSSNTGTTLTDDDTLKFAIAANEVWFVQARLIFTAANATMDAKITFTMPSGGTMLWGTDGAPAFGGYAPSATGSSPATMVAAAASIAVGTFNGTNGLGVAGVARNSSTAGNVTLQWAQNTSDAGNLVLNADSILIAWRLA